MASTVALETKNTTMFKASTRNSGVGAPQLYDKMNPNPMSKTTIIGTTFRCRSVCSELRPGLAAVDISIAPVVQPLSSDETCESEGFSVLLLPERN